MNEADMQISIDECNELFMKFTEDLFALQKKMMERFGKDGSEPVEHHLNFYFQCIATRFAASMGAATYDFMVKPEIWAEEVLERFNDLISDLSKDENRSATDNIH